MRKILGTLIVMALAACGGDEKNKTDVQAQPDMRSLDGPAGEVQTDLIEDLSPIDAVPLDVVDSDSSDAIIWGPDTPQQDLQDATDGAFVDILDSLPEIPDSLPEIPDLQPETDVGDEPLTCELDFECAEGQTCDALVCTDMPLCGGDIDCPDEALSCLAGKCLAEGMSPFSGSVIINEILADGTADEDANQDGTVDAMEDEFIELVVVSSGPVDMSGWMIAEGDWDVWLPRHTFGDQTTLQPLDAAVVFGGGDPLDSTATVLYVGANAEDPGIPYGLDFNDDGEEIRLLDAEGLLVDSFTYGGDVPVASDQSLTRSPDLTGDWQPHLDADGAAGAIFSPGTRVDGSSF